MAVQEANCKFVKVIVDTLTEDKPTIASIDIEVEATSFVKSVVRISPKHH